MKLNHAFLRAALLIVALTHASILTLRADHAPRAVLPDAVVDLRTTEGVARVKAQWRYSDTRINEIDHRSVGSDLKASGPKNRTFDFTPDARATDFDDSKWELIPADSLEKRRGNGRLSLNWYRLDLTIPEKVGGFDTRGSTAVLKSSWMTTRKFGSTAKRPSCSGRTAARSRPAGTRPIASC